MKWNININQKAIIDLEVNIDLIDAAILNQCMSFSHSDECEKMHHEGKTFYWFGYENTLKQLPLIKIKKDTLYRRFKKMVDVGLLDPHPNNQSLGRPFYRFTPLTHQINYGYKSEGSEINPGGYGYKSEGGTEINPDYNNIIDNTIKKPSIDSVGTTAPTPEGKRTLVLTNDQAVSVETFLKSQKKEEAPGGAAKPKRAAFEPPSLSAVQEYFEEKEVFGKEAENFWNYYEANGWKVGKNKMQKWKAAASNWIGRMPDYKRKQANQPLTQEERQQKNMAAAQISIAMREARIKEREEREKRWNNEY
jgi:hypothetical protein